LTDTPDDLKRVDGSILTPEEQQAYYPGVEVDYLKDVTEPPAPPEISDDVKDRLEAYLREQLPKVDTENSLGDLSFTLSDLIALGAEQYKVSPNRVKVLIDAIEREKDLYVTAEVATRPEKDTVTQIYFENNPERGIRLITKKTPREGGNVRYQDDIILSYFLESVSKTVNPLEAGDISYSVRLRHCRKRRSVLTYEDESIGNISTHIGLTAPGIRSKLQLHGAISSLIDAFEEAGLVNEETRIPATGFFEYKDVLHWSESKVFQCTLPEYSDRKTKLALEALEKVADFYAIRGHKDGDHLKHFLPALYFIVVSPLSVIRKMGGGEAKVLLLHGQTHAGKTYLEKLSCAIWGIPPQAGIIGAARLSGPQYAEAVNKTTLPIAFDEARNALSSPAIADLIKSSTMNLLIKNRITRDFKMKSFMAYAGVMMSTNFVPELYAGMADRLISIEFTRQHKREDKDVRSFETFFNGDGRLILAHIGSGLREMYLKKWGTCKRLLLNDDQLKAGRELLMMLYRKHNLPVPDWMVEVTEGDNRPEEDDPLKLVFDWMRDDIHRILRQNRRVGGDVPRHWDDRLDMLQEDNLLPNYIKSISKSNINVTKELIREMARSGIELPGGLTGLLHIVNDHPAQSRKNDRLTNKEGVKVVRIDRALFMFYAERSDIQLEVTE